MNGVSIAASLHSLGKGKYLANVAGRNANLTNVTNPVVITLTIGKNSGTRSVTAVFAQLAPKKSVSINNDNAEGAQSIQLAEENDLYLVLLALTILRQFSLTLTFFNATGCAQRYYFGPWMIESVLKLESKRMRIANEI